MFHLFLSMFIASMSQCVQNKWNTISSFSSCTSPTLLELLSNDFRYNICYVECTLCSNSYMGSRARHPLDIMRWEFNYMSTFFLKIWLHLTQRNICIRLLSISKFPNQDTYSVFLSLSIGIAYRIIRYIG